MDLLKHELIRDFIKYSRSRDTKMINYLLSKGIGVNFYNVVLEIRRRNYDKVEAYISDGFNFELYGQYLLHECFRDTNIDYEYFDYEYFDYLINKNVKIDESTIIYSIFNNYFEIVKILIEKSNLDDESYINCYYGAIEICYDEAQLVIDKFNDPASINKLIIDAIIEEKEEKEILFVINNSQYKGRTDYLAIFKDIISNYSNDDYRNLFLFSKPEFSNYILKNACTDCIKAINVLREHGVDIYDMMEKEN